MKKGKMAKSFAGVLDILLGLFLLFIGISFLLSLLDVFSGFTFLNTFTESFFYYLYSIFNLSFSNYEMYSYIYSSVIALMGILSLTFGICTLVKTGKSRENYYKKHSGVGVAVIETIYGLIFSAHLYPYIKESVSFQNFWLIVVVCVAFFIVLLFRYIGVGLFKSGKKAFNNVK